MSTIAFITPCCAKVRRALEQALLVGVLLLCGSLARAGAELEQLRVERVDSSLLLHASLKLELSGAVEEALLKGVPVHFVAEAELMRDRWYWYDRKLTQVSRYYRLAYQPLTLQWRVQVSAEPIGTGASGSRIAQSFDTLSSALEAIRRQSGWKLAEASELDPDSRQYVLYRFRLDMSQLPRPFQIAADSQSDWAVGLSRQLRLSSDLGR